MRAFFFSILGHFLSPGGLVLMAVLDASPVFYMPLGIDFIVVIMTARQPQWSWIFALLATLGSVLGAGLTFWIGRKGGELGLKRFVNPMRLERVKARVSRGAVIVAALAVMPPPFPFTPFVLTSGALEMNPWSFFGMLAVARMIRFAIETALAWRYGSQILRWMETPSFEAAVGMFIALAVIGTAVSLVALMRSSKSSSALS